MKSQAMDTEEINVSASDPQSFSNEHCDLAGSELPAADIAARNSLLENNNIYMRDDLSVLSPETDDSSCQLSLVDKLVNLMAILPGSVIAPMLPVVNRFSLKTVSISTLLLNPKFRHRFLFNDDLVFKSLKSMDETEKEEIYWIKIENEVKWILEFQQTRKRPPMLYPEYRDIPLIYIPLFLNEMREIMSEIYFENQRKFPSGLLDMEKIIEQLELGNPIDFGSFLPRLINALYLYLKMICKKNEPVINGMPGYSLLREMYYTSFNIPNCPNSLTLYLRAFMNVVETVKLESVNAYLKEHRGYLIDLIAAYEYEAVLASGMPKLFVVLKEIVSEMAAGSIVDIYYEMIWKLVVFHIDFLELPETFSEDVSLFKTAQHSLDIILRMYIFLLCLEKLVVLNEEFISYITSPNSFFANAIISSLNEQKRIFKARGFLTNKDERMLLIAILEMFNSHSIKARLSDIKLAISISLSYFSPKYQPRLFSICKMRLKPLLLSFLKGCFEAKKGQILSSFEPLIRSRFDVLKTVTTYNLSTFRSLYLQVVNDIRDGR